MEQTDGRNWYDSINKTARFSGGNAPEGLGGTFTEFFFVPHSFPKYQDHIKKKKQIHYEILNSQLLLVTVKFKAIFNM